MKIAKRTLAIILAVLMVITSVPLFVLASTPETDADAAIGAFEAKMDGTIYKGMADAYAAYVELNKAYDSYKKGKLDVDTLNVKISNLNSKVSAMTNWSRATDSFTGTDKATFDADNDYITDENYAQVYKNVLFGKKSIRDPIFNSGNRPAGPDEYTASFGVYYADTTLLYDGITEPQFGTLVGVNTGEKPSDWKWENLRLYYVTVSDASGFQFIGHWRGNDSRRNFQWNYLSHLDSDCSNIAEHINNGFNGVTSGKTDGEYYLANIVKFTSNNSFDTNSDGVDDLVMLTVKPQITYDIGQKDSSSVYTCTPNANIRVLNYKLVLDTMEKPDNLNKLKNVSEYRIGGLETVLAGYEKAMTDPNSFFVTENAYADCEENYTYAINQMNSTPVKKTQNDLPITDQESAGDILHTSGVIYTHKSNDTYAKYGQQIADDYAYRTSVEHKGERCTKLVTTYPYLISVDDDAIYCLTDEKLVEDGYTGGTFRVNDYNHAWVDANGNLLTDSEAKTKAKNGETVERYYALQGKVSNYFHYHYDGDTVDDGNTSESTKALKNNEYTETGVELIVRYYDVETNKTYGEFEFLYVAPNPVMAHSIVGIRNQRDNTGSYNRKGSQTNYYRFDGSYGTTTDIVSDKVGHIYGAETGGKETSYRVGGGTFKYAGIWGTDEASMNNTGDLKSGYTSPDKTAGAFTFYDKTIGSNAGAFAQLEHESDNLQAYTVSTPVVDTDYYIDYSNEELYDFDGNGDNLITVDESGKPTGYMLNLKASNIYWASTQPRRWGATSFMLLNGDLKNKVRTDANQRPEMGDSYNAGYNTKDEYRETYGNFSETELAEMGITKEADFLKYYQMLESGTGHYSTNLKSDSALQNQKCNEPKRTALNKDVAPDNLTLKGVPNVWSLGLVDYDKTVEDTSVGTETKPYSRMVMSGYYSDPAGYAQSLGISADATEEEFSTASDAFTKGLTKGFQYIDAGNSDTNTWNQHISFIGKDSIKKNTDTSSAEKYANLILEQGVSVYEWRFVLDMYRQATTEETYAYYNIGVNTCDKYAVREFVDIFCNKKMVVKAIDGTDWTPDCGKRVGAIIPGEEIKSGEYTVASYKEYLDAIAEAYYFVNNPKNTTYTDENGVEREYTTAYGLAPDGQNHAMIYSDDVTGFDGNPTKNIFGETSNDDGSPITTDPVQAKIIQDIIMAYANLFSAEDYKNSEAKFNEAKEELKILLDDVNGEYTATSVNAWAGLIDGIKSNYGYYLKNEEGEEVDYNGNTYEGDGNYWRYVELTGSEYNQINEAIDTIKSSLMPKIDTSVLSSNIDTQEAKLNQGVVQDSEQTKSFSSWKAMYDEVVKAKNMIAATTTEDADGFYPGQFKPTGIKTYEFNGVTYKYQTFDDSIKSSLQEEFYTEQGPTGELMKKELKNVDAPEAYESYDAAKSVVKSINADKAKYNQAGIDYINDTVNALDPVVYAVLDEATKNAYKSYTGVDLTGSKVKNTSWAETDQYTANLLNAVGTISAPDDTTRGKYVNKFKTELIVKDDLGNTLDSSGENTEFYGTNLTFDATSLGVDLNGYNLSKWIVELKGADNSTIGKQTISGAIGTRINRIIDSNIVVTAIFTKDESASGTVYTYKICDAYGKEIAYEYSAEKYTSENIASHIKTQSIPFYEIKGWILSEPDENNVITVKPDLVPVGLYEIKVTDGNVNGSSSDNFTFDSKVTVKYEGSDTFVAWAVKKSDNRYQIASYSESYTFYVAANESYVPVTKNGSAYYVDGKVLTADIIESSVSNDTGNISPDNFVYQKLEKKAPFVSIVDVRKENDNKKVRAYVRVTEGSNVDNSIKSYGVKFAKGAYDNKSGFNSAVSYTRATNNMLSTGQYSYTLTSASAISYNITYVAYVDYEFTYTVDKTTSDMSSVSTQISARDYSSYVHA